MVSFVSGQFDWLGRHNYFRFRFLICSEWAVRQKHGDMASVLRRWTCRDDRNIVSVGRNGKVHAHYIFWPTRRRTMSFVLHVNVRALGG